MLSKTLLDELNNQVKYEFYSAYLYLAMAAHFDEANWYGFASWMKKQSAEEQEHAMKFISYIHDRGGAVVLQALDQPPSKFGKPAEIFAEVLKHEQFVTGRINLLYSIAVKDNDYASQNTLNWFVGEQVEEEKTAAQILDWLKLAGDATSALFQINNMLASRA
jgi:ferritin